MVCFSNDTFRIGKGFLAGLVALTVVCCGAVTVYASKSDLNTLKSTGGERASLVTLTRGMAEIVEMPGPVADVMVANPSIVDVSALQANKLYVVGLNYGTTNMIAVDEGGNVLKRINVHVKIDDVAIQSMIRKLFPDEDVNVSSTAAQVILTGHVSTPDVAQRITNLVAQYTGEVQGNGGDANADSLIVNLLKVSGEQQVMLRVKVLEASRDMLRELGIETSYVEPAGRGNLTGGFATNPGLGLTSDPLGLANIIYNATDFGPMQLIIRALEDSGLVNTLAEPNLTAISGEQAGFLAGGEIPIPTSRDRDGNILVSYRPFGVALNFRPVVLSNDRISLQLQTEVSSVSSQGSQNVNGLLLPSFSVRRAETTVEMGSGGSLMIAGLLQSQVTKNMTKLPGIKDIPILGDLISSDSFQRQETELLVIVTPYLVKPYADGSNAVDVPKAQSEARGPGGSVALSQAFEDNIQRIYSRFRLPADLFAKDGGYGYLIQ